jgi:trehalose-phosphatase
VFVPIRWFPGAWVERKPGCLAVHYRDLSPLKAACFVEEVNNVLAEVTADGPALRIRDVTRTLEVSLASAWTKGDAVGRMLDGRNATAFPAYVGDGASDAEAVDAVNARRGVTVGIGPEAPPATRFRVPSAAAFAAGLADLATALSGSLRPARSVPSVDTARTDETPILVRTGAR